MTDSMQWNEHSGKKLDSSTSFNVIDCVACGFRHIIPIPTAEDLDAVYREEYYSIEKPLYIERVREDLPWWEMVYEDRYSMFEAHLPPTKRRALDVGAGPGFFLLHGKKRGWDVVGIEPSRQAVAHAMSLGVNVVEGFLDEASAPKLGTFDVVHLSEVLEHVPDPMGILRLTHGLLNPGGLVCLIVPNDYNPFQHALRTVLEFPPWWVAVPHHINYFDFDSLEGIMRKSGFEPIHRESSFPMELFLLMGDNYVGHDELGRVCHAKRKKFELTLQRAGLSQIKRELYGSLAKLGLGRDALIVGRRV